MRTANDLMAHQGAAIQRNLSARKQANLLKMGLGKTAINEFTILELRPKRVLIVAPATVVEREVWQREAAQWKELQGAFDMVAIAGTAAQRLRKLNRVVSSRQVQVDVISYELIPWLQHLGVERLEEVYDCIIFDELSKVKTPGSARFRVLRSYAAEIALRFGLTGSPVGNHLLDLWGEMFMVAGKEPLGPSFSLFKTEWFTPTNLWQPEKGEWLPRAGAEEFIIERIKPHAFSLSEKLTEGILPRVLVNPVDVELPGKVRDLADRLWQECRAELPSGEELVALAASTKAMKMRQLASGAVYYDPLDETKWEVVHDHKLKALGEVLEEQQGEPVICFYWFRHELERILARFPHARVASNAVLDAWDRREIPLLLLHPGSTAHGLNLQFGGSSVVWYTLPYSHELWEQGNGRVARPGQRAPYVTATGLCAGEGDRAVLELLSRKGSTQSRVMAGVELEDLTSDPCFG